MKRIILVLACSVMLFSVSAQKKHGQARIDSLVSELPKQKNETTKTDVLNSISGTYYFINPDSGVKYGKAALELSEKIQYKKGIADANDRLGVNFEYKSEYSLALDYHFKALKIRNEIGNQKEIEKSFTNIGLVYSNLSDFTTALEYYFKALKISEELKNKSSVGTIYNNIGIIYNDLSDNPKALEYYFKALKISEEIGNKALTATSIGNISITYYHQGDFPKALESFLKALKLNEELGNESTVANVTGGIGTTYNQLSDYSKALEYGFKAVRLYEKLGDKLGAASNLGNVGVVYLSLVLNDRKEQLRSLAGGNKIVALRKAKIYLDSAIFIFKEINNLDLLMLDYEKLSAIDSAMGDSKGALAAYKNYALCKDTIFNIEKDKKLTQTAMNYEFAKKQLADSLNHVQENKVSEVKLQRQKSITYAGFAGIGLIGLSLFFVFRNYKNQKKANKIITKEKDRSENLLLNILPAEVAEELKETGSTKAKNFDLVTVLFTDFKEFTQISEKLTPEQLVGEINHCFSAFDNIIVKYGIEKIKTIGDAYMCAGGLPSANATHPDDVVKAALEIKDFMINYKKEKDAKGETSFEIRIGINTGPVVAGIVGVKKFAYDIWGDTVNIAARMESSSTEGKVNISGSTYELVKDKFKCIHRGKIEAKNKGMIDMYFVEAKGDS